MRKHIILLITLSIFLPYLTQGQSFRKIDKMIVRYDYDKAIGKLLQAARKDSKRDQAIPLLAECYQAQNDFYNASVWYEKAIDLPKVEPKYYYEYGRCLMATGNYSKAKQAFDRYNELLPNNLEGKVKARSCDSILDRWQYLPPKYSIGTIGGINTSASEFGAINYSNDLLYISDYKRSIDNSDYYGWTGRGYLKVMRAQLKSEDNPSEFERTGLFDSKFNQRFHDGPIAINQVGDMLFLTRTYRDKPHEVNDYKTNMIKLFYSLKKDGKWSKLEPFAYNSKDYSVGHASFSQDGKTLYFTSDMPGGEGGTDIWMSKLEGDSWGKPVNLGKNVNTRDNEMFPSVGDDGNLYFSSDGHPGFGGLDIFKITLTNEGKADGTAMNLLLPLNSSADDFTFYQHPEGMTGYFASNRTGGSGNDDIYTFTALPEPEAPKPTDPDPTFITGRVLDKDNKTPIENATVFVYNPNTQMIYVLKTDHNGVYKYEVKEPGKYIIKGAKHTYIPDCTPLTLAEIKEGAIVNARELYLERLGIDKVITIENIYYDFDKYNIRADAKPELDKLVKFMNDYAITVELGSHTDSRGSHAYNDRLSQRRAESVVNYVTSHGISQDRMTAKGYGERQLVNDCKDGVPCSKEEHQKNRRTEIKILGYTSPQQQIGKFNPDTYNKGQVLAPKDLPSDFYDDCK